MGRWKEAGIDRLDIEVGSCYAEAEKISDSVMQVELCRGSRNCTYAPIILDADQAPHEFSCSPHVALCRRIGSLSCAFEWLI